MFALSVSDLRIFVKRFTKGKRVVVVNQAEFFTVPDCPLCDEVREWLKDNRVMFIERDVAGDFGSFREMYNLTGQRLVPVVSFKSKAVVRPDVGLLANLLL